RFGQAYNEQLKQVSQVELAFEKRGPEAGPIAALQFVGPEKRDTSKWKLRGFYSPLDNQLKLIRVVRAREFTQWLIWFSGAES
ncbi:TPA: hypothetical protein ACNV11_005983, partial [Klebsiella pneumoniae]